MLLILAPWSSLPYHPPLHFIQLRNKLNQEQNAKLQQQRECLNKRNSEVAVMDKRVNELRDRLWKKKAALQQKENLPVSEVVCAGPGSEHEVSSPRDKGRGCSVRHCSFFPLCSVLPQKMSTALFSDSSVFLPVFVSSGD